MIRELNHIAHSQFPQAVASCSWDTDRGFFRAQVNSSHIRQSTESALFQIGNFARAGSALHCAPARSVAPRAPSRAQARHNLHIDSKSSCSVALRKSGGVVPCTEQYRRALMRRVKPSDTIVGSPTDLSATYFQTSRSSCFGLKIQRQSSRMRVAAACDRPSAFSAVTVNGRVMPSPRSCKKFSFVKECATSA